MTSREKRVVISSDDKDSGSISNSNFKVTLRERYSTQSVDRISIAEIIVPNCFYNISDGDVKKGNGPANNVLIFSSILTGNLTVTLTAGQYNILQLIAFLQSNMDTALAPYGINVVINRSDITNLLSFAFSAESWTFYGFSSMSSVLGFIDDVGPYNSSSTVLLPYPPDLSGINSVYIHSEALSDGSGIDANKGIINLVDAVSLHNVPYGTFAYKQTTDDAFALINYTMPRNLNVIDIRLRDREGNLLDIGTKRLTLIIKMYYSV
jgi:hypothetical protein